MADEVIEKVEDGSTFGTWKHPPPAAVSGQTLFTRMGGLPNLKLFVDDFYDAMLKDAVMGRMLKTWMQTAPQEMYMRHLKDRTIDYLECVWDGDTWSGQDLFIAHAHLHMSVELFARAIKAAKSLLGRMPFSREVRAQILKEFEVMKIPITDPDGKFHAFIAKRQKDMEARSKAAAEASGDLIMTKMGFTISRAELDAIEARKNKDEARRAALLKQKAIREAKEAEEKALKKTVAEAKKKPDAAAPTSAKKKTDTPVLNSAQTPSTPSPRQKGKRKNKPTTTPKDNAIMPVTENVTTETEMKDVNCKGGCNVNMMPPLPAEDGVPCIPETRPTRLLCHAAEKEIVSDNMSTASPASDAKCEATPLEE